MFLKSLTLKGFLCYKDSTTVDFHPGFNVIVGPNGSGKSSLLAGIRFVLGTDEGERRTFLHQGKSARALNGYVTAVLDNSDRRASGIADTEIVIRREFGVKRDELMLNNKIVSRKELNNVLESAGLPRSNPFYLVYQHEVTALARVTPEERYAVLKNVAGTQVYEERRKEALQNLEKSTARRREIDDSLEMIRRRVKELQVEQQRLIEYTELDKEQKCLEALFAKKKMDELNHQLSELGQSRAAVADKIETAERKSTELQETLEAAREDIETARITTQRATANLADRRQEHIERTAEATRLQLDFEDAERKAKEAERQKQRALERKEELQARRLQAEQEAQQLNTQLQAAVDATQQAAADLCSARAAAAALENASGVSSIAGRKKSLVATAKQTEKDAKIFKQKVHDLSGKVASLQSEWDEAKQRLNEQRDRRNALMTIAADAVDYGAKIDELLAEKRELRQRLDQSRDKIDRANHGAARAERALLRTVRPGVVTANQCIMDWARNTGDRGDVLGPLIDLITVPEAFWVAVERAAGAELFNLLVANAQIARTAVELIKTRKAGGTTITPLKETEKLLPRSRAPTDVPGVRPMTSVVECSDRVAIAVRQVLGRFLLVDNLDLGRQWTAKGFDCVTLEGDQVSRKGILSGGWHGQATRLRLAAELRLKREERFSAEEAYRSHQAHNEELEKHLAEFQSKRRENDAAENERRRQYDDAAESVTFLTSRVDTLKTQMVVAQAELGDATHQLEMAHSAIQAVRREILTCEDDGQENTPEGRIQSLARQIPTLVAEAQRLAAELSLLQARKEGVESLVEQLSTELESLEWPVALPLCAEQLRQSWLRQKERVDAVEGEIEVLHDDIKKNKAALTSAGKCVHEIERTTQHLKTKMNKWRGQLEEFDNRHAILAKQQTTAEAMSTEVAGMRDVLDRLGQLTAQELSRKQLEISRRIEAFGWVNTKAADELRGVVADVESLEKQKEDLFASEDSVYKLMETFDQQKADTLLKTFENVNQNFSSIFARIVKGGEAHLVLKRLAADELQAAAASSQQQFDPFVGVGIKLRFPGSQALAPLESLSGGQKSVAALSIIFALQQVDSAPLFVLDEVDAALDTSYRSAVANVVKAQAVNHQMIVISHRAQIISAADYFLRTAIVNQESLVVVSNLEEALLVSQRQAVEEGEQQQPRAIAAA